MRWFQKEYNSAHDVKIREDGAIDSATWNAMGLPEPNSELYLWMRDKWDSSNSSHNAYYNNVQSSTDLWYAKCVSKLSPTIGKTSSTPVSQPKISIPITQGTGKDGDWIPNEMNLNGSSPQEKALRADLATLPIKWDQKKIHALWEACKAINGAYGIQIDPRFLVAIIIHEGTGSFNTSSENKAADGQNGVEADYAKDLMKANSLIFGKILGYIYYGSKFRQAVSQNPDYGGINGNGDIFQYCNWSTPIIRMNTKKVETGEYAGDGSWHVDVRDIYNSLSGGAAGQYDNYLSSIDSSVAQKIAGSEGIKLPSYNFVPSKNAQDSRGRPNGKWTIIGTR